MTMQWEALCRNADRLLFRQLMQRRLEQGDHSMPQVIHGFYVTAYEDTARREHEPSHVTSADQPLEKGGAMKRI
ncbi:MAG TPA: hypothetical protein VLC51_00420, partial [Nitrospira sp.]|nr:hypothetical protein [Nitrospira sp.]